jgi:hypothetical protein
LLAAHSQSSAATGFTVLKRQQIFAVLLAVTCSAFGPLFAAADEHVRFDGLYATSKFQDGVRYSKYLKFLPDGVVMGVSTVGEPKDIQEWFNPKNENVGRGRYRLNGSRIWFSLTSKAGVVDYVGEVIGGDLQLFSHSQINQNEGEETYSFVEAKAER